jgi:hypothetical protein
MLLLLQLMPSDCSRHHNQADHNHTSHGLIFVQLYTTACGESAASSLMKACICQLAEGTCTDSVSDGFANSCKGSSNNHMHCCVTIPSDMQKELAKGVTCYMNCNNVKQSSATDCTALQGAATASTNATVMLPLRAHKPTACNC